MFIQYYLHDQKRGLVGGQTYFCARSARIYSLIHGDDDTRFRNKSFILDEMTKQIASKAIFIEVFSYSKYTANFEADRKTITSSINILFLKNALRELL